MTIPSLAWDGLDSRPQGGNTREHPMSTMTFGIGWETHDFNQLSGLYGKKLI